MPALPDRGEDFVDLVEPLGVLGLHEDGAEGGYGGFVAADRGGEIWEKGGREFGEGQVEIFGGGGLEDSPGLGGDFGKRGGVAFWARDEDHDVEFGFEGGDEFIASFEFLVESERGVYSLLQVLGEFAIFSERQQFLRGPEGGGCGAGARTFETDFAEVKFGGAEVGVGRIVFVEAADSRIAEENAAAAVRLETVLVRVDDDGVNDVETREGAVGVGAEIFRQIEIAAVSRVNVNPEAILFAEIENHRKRVDGASGGGAESCDHGADVVLLFETLLKSVVIHSRVGADWDGFEVELEDAADTVMRVVGLFAGDNFFAGGELAGDPECFEIGHRAAASEMAEKILPVEHCGDFGDGLFFESAGGAAAIERVIVGIDEHRQRVGEARDGMRRLEHLAGVERVKVGVVVLEAGGEFVQYLARPRSTGNLRVECGKTRETSIEGFGGGDKGVEGVEVDHLSGRL